MKNVKSKKKNSQVLIRDIESYYKQIESSLLIVESADLLSDADVYQINE